MPGSTNPRARRRLSLFNYGKQSSTSFNNSETNINKPELSSLVKRNIFKKEPGESNNNSIINDDDSNSLSVSAHFGSILDDDEEEDKENISQTESISNVSQNVENNLNILSPKKTGFLLHRNGSNSQSVNHCMSSPMANKSFSGLSGRFSNVNSQANSANVSLNPVLQPINPIFDYKSPSKSNANNSLSFMSRRQNRGEQIIYASPLRNSPRKKRKTCHFDELVSLDKNNSVSMSSYNYNSDITTSVSNLANFDLENSRNTTCSTNGTNSFMSASMTNINEILRIPTLPLDWGLKTEMNLIFDRANFGDLSVIKQNSKAMVYGMDINEEFKNLVNGKTTNLTSRILKALQFFIFPSYDYQDFGSNSETGSKSQKAEINYSFPKFKKSCKLSHLNEHQVKILYKHFSDSLTCLYQMFKSNQVPYFYILSERCTYLFRNSELIIWPATKSVKKTLDDENIRYEEICKNGKKSNKNSETKDSDDDEITPTSPKFNRSMSQPTESGSKTPTKRSSSSKSSDTEVSNSNSEDDAETNGKCKTPLVKIITRRRSMTDKDLKNRETKKRGQKKNTSIIKIKSPPMLQRIFKLILKPEFFSLNNPTSLNSPPTLLSPINFENSTCKTSEYSIKVKPNDKQLFCITAKNGILLPHSCWLISKILIERSILRRNADNFCLSGRFEIDNSTSGLNVREKLFEGQDQLQVLQENVSTDNKNVIQDQLKGASHGGFSEFVKNGLCQTVTKFTYENGNFKLFH